MMKTTRLFKRFLLLLLILPALCGWTEAGFNFRDTSGFVTDGAGETYVLGNPDAYPVTRGGFTFGWSTTVADMSRDRDNSVDRRLAGVNKATNDGTQAVFQVDLSATGTYVVCIAVGDAVFDSGYEYFKVLDNSTVKFTVDDTDGLLAPNFDDANGTEWSASAWPASNTCQTITFASTTFKLVIGSPGAQAGSTEIAHVRITASGGGGGGGSGEGVLLLQAGGG